MDYPCFQRPAFLTGHYCTPHWDPLQRAPCSEPHHASAALHSSVYVHTHTHTIKNAKPCLFVWCACSSVVDLIDLSPRLSMIITAALQTQGQVEDSHSHVEAESDGQNFWWITSSLHLTNRIPVSISKDKGRGGLRLTSLSFTHILTLTHAVSTQRPWKISSYVLQTILQQENTVFGRLF